VRDLAWSEDSKRIIAVGEGREKYVPRSLVSSPRVAVAVVVVGMCRLWVGRLTSSLMIVPFRARRFGTVFMWDSGSSVGEITGQSKTILTCDFKVCSHCTLLIIIINVLFLLLNCLLFL
jgi:hypothetical protein